MEIREISLSQYAREVNKFQSATPFHSVDWLRCVQEIYGITFIYIALMDDGNIYALNPIFVRKYGPIKLYGSPLPQSGTPAIMPLISEGYEELFLNKLDAWIHINKYRYFQLTWKHDLVFKKNIEATILDNLEIDLSFDIESLFSNMKSEARNRIRKAVRMGVKVHWAQSNEKLSEYFSLLKSTYSRQDIPQNFPDELYTKLFESLHNNSLKIIYATYNDSIIAMLWIFFDNNKCYFWDGASNQDFRKYSANHLLHWEIIKWAKDNNLKFYDMIGRSIKSGRSGARPGIGRFKKSLGASAYEYYTLYWRSDLFKQLLRFYRLFLNMINKPRV